MISIYGMDDNDFAQDIARDALGHQGAAPKAGSPSSKGISPQDPGDVKVIKGAANDSRACVKGNHGEQGCDN